MPSFFYIKTIIVVTRQNLHNQDNKTRHGAVIIKTAELRHFEAILKTALVASQHNRNPTNLEESKTHPLGIQHNSTVAFFLFKNRLKQCFVLRYASNLKLATFFTHYVRLLSSSFIVHHKVSRSYNPRTVWPSVINQTPTLAMHSHAGYDVTSCFPLATKCNWILHRSA